MVTRQEETTDHRPKVSEPISGLLDAASFMLIPNKPNWHDFPIYFPSGSAKSWSPCYYY